MTNRTVFAICVAGLMLTGCAQTGPKQGLGAFGGAIAGGVIGSAVGNGSAGAVAGGAVLGAFLGGALGAQLDAADQRAAQEASYRALETGQTGTPVSWRNANSGHYGEVTPGPSYRVNAYNCRDYTQTIYIDGRPQMARGTACKQPDGTWKPVA
jgi:surface antigen